MSNSRIVEFSLSLSFLFAGCAGGALDNNISLSVDGQNPVVLMEPDSGTEVELAVVTYDKFGRVDSYDCRIKSGNASRTIKIRQKGPSQFGKMAEYEAELNGKPVPPSKADSGKIGFSLKTQGGTLLSYKKDIQISMKSELGYDNNGRAYVKRETFAHGGKNFDITFANHSHDKNGRLTGYKATVKIAK